MEFSAKQIADFIGGRVEGDEDSKVSSFAKIEEAGEGALSFVSDPKYLHYLRETKASVVLVSDNLEFDWLVGATLIRVKDAREAVAKLLGLYAATRPRKTGIAATASIEETARIGQDVYIGPNAVIGDGAIIGDGTQIYPGAVIGDGVEIGRECIIYPNVTVYYDCKIGDNVIIHAGAVIGADGFGFAPTPSGYEKIPQIGNVVIEDDVEIGANTCIDRSTMGSTIIHKGVKLDDLVMIAHNVAVGSNTVMSAQVGIAGSTKVGEWCMFGGQVGIAGHITIGDKVMLGAQSGVPGSIASGQSLIGSPPMELKPFFKSQAILRRLPEMYKQLGAIEKELKELRDKI